MVSLVNFMNLLDAILYDNTGPAKVYTLRGKYRQFFLRVSADNVDETSSANIIVTKMRTLDIVIETVRVLSLFQSYTWRRLTTCTY